MNTPPPFRPLGRFHTAKPRIDQALRDYRRALICHQIIAVLSFIMGAAIIILALAFFA